LGNYDYEKDEEEFQYSQSFKSYILTHPSRSFNRQPKALGIEVTKLTEVLPADPLIFPGDRETPWLDQKNDYSR